MKGYFIFCISFFYFQFCFAQKSISHYPNISAGGQSTSLNTTDAGMRTNINSLYQEGAPSPYKTTLIKDGLVITGAVGLTLIGYELIKNKHDLTLDQLAGKTKDKLPFFDKGNAGYYSPRADKDSYILFDAAY